MGRVELQERLELRPGLLPGAHAEEGLAQGEAGVVAGGVEPEGALGGGGGLGPPPGPVQLEGEDGMELRPPGVDGEGAPPGGDRRAAPLELGHDERDRFQRRQPVGLLGQDGLERLEAPLLEAEPEHGEAQRLPGEEVVRVLFQRLPEQAHRTGRPLAVLVPEHHPEVPADRLGGPPVAVERHQAHRIGRGRRRGGHRRQGALAVAGDQVERGGDVGDVGRRGPRHVAGDAVVGGAAGPSLVGRQRTARIGVAAQAAVAVIRHLLGRRRQLVRVVAGDAAQGALALAEAAALRELLGVVDVRVLAGRGRRDEARHEFLERQARPVVGPLPAVAVDLLRPAQVALIADVIPEGRRQVARVDDRGARARHLHRLADVEFARPVAALAADRVAPEDRRAIAALGPLDVLDPVGVAVQAPRGDLPAEVVVPPLEPRREGPVPLLIGEPGDRRLEEEVVATDEEGVAEPARAEDVPDLALDLPDRPALVVEVRLAMDRPPVPPLEGVAGPPVLEQDHGRLLAPERRRRLGDRDQRLAHRVLAVARGDVRVALRAGRVADVVDAGAGVPVGRRQRRQARRRAPPRPPGRPEAADHRHREHRQEEEASGRPTAAGISGQDHVPAVLLEPSRGLRHSSRRSPP